MRKSMMSVEIIATRQPGMLWLLLRELLGLMLSAGEIPRIAGAFGLDTSTRANLSSAVYTAQTAINITKTVAKAAAA